MMNIPIEWFRPIESPFRHKPGILVKVAPCGEQYGRKTYIGILVGDATIGFLKDDKGNLQPYRNPMILIPETHSVVFGCESWWGKIDTVDELHQITDEEIANIWYVKLLKDIAEREKEAKGEKA